LGSQENILKAKLEIVEGLDENGVLITNANDPLLRSINKNIARKIVYVGVETEANYNAYSVVDFGEEGIGFKIKLEGKEYDVRVPAVGVHNVYNVLFGIACGVELGLSVEEILNGINNYHSGEMRLNIIEKNGIKFINDCYNACPDSMRAGLQVLNGLSKDGRTFAVLGNMFELGEMASTAHYNVGKTCKELEIDFAVIMGENANDVAKGIGDINKYKIFKTHEEIIEYLKGTLRNGDIVLVKGSRGMKMERILDLW
jgi:UDP-N-acetylmuramoyl-tripeptide--D-alanyl-D-alanine ligase